MTAPAQIAYEAYAKSRERYEGSWLPDWKHLEPRTKEAWAAAAKAVGELTMGGMARVGDGVSVQDV